MTPGDHITTAISQRILPVSIPSLLPSLTGNPATPSPLQLVLILVVLIQLHPPAHLALPARGPKLCLSLRACLRHWSSRQGRWTEGEIRVLPGEEVWGGRTVAGVYGEEVEAHVGVSVRKCLGNVRAD